MVYEFVYAFVGYLAVLGILGIYSHRNSGQENSESLLGGRSLGYITTAIAAHSSDMSLWIFMGLPSIVYVSGMKIIWVPIGLLIGMYLTWKYIAAPLRIQTEAYHSETLSSFFQNKCNDTTGHIKLVSTLLSLFFFTMYIASALVGLGRLFELVFQIDYFVGVGIGLITALLYTSLGGFVGVAHSHLFQGLFLATMIVLVPLLAYFSLPTGTSISEIAQLKSISLSFIPDNFQDLISSLIIAISWGLAYFGQPHILINFMGMKDPKSVPAALRVGMLWQIFTLAASMAIGIIGIAFFIIPLANPQLVFVAMTQQLFTPFFAGCICCAIMAAGLTTIDTQMLICASSFSNDLYKEHIRPQATRRELFYISKLGLIIVPFFSCLMIALSSDNSTVYGLVEYAWNGLGASFGPAVLACLYLPRITKNGILYGMIVGGITSALWPLLATGIPPLIPAFCSNMAIILLTTKK